jgi:Putative peptidoglycan binding domain
MKASTLLSASIAVAALTAPLTGYSDHKVTVYRDRDGDGHFNKKTYDGGHGHRSYYNYRSSYYRPYNNYPGYYGHYYPRSSFGVSIFSRPSYVYRGYSADYGDSLAADVQRALRSRGYYRGYVDGDIGAGSRAAIRAYQADHGLAITGRIDSVLLRSLRIG